VTRARASVRETRAEGDETSRKMGLKDDL
jgi:hypothetical protein